MTSIPRPAPNSPAPQRSSAAGASDSPAPQRSSAAGAPDSPAPQRSSAADASDNTNPLSADARTAAAQAADYPDERSIEILDGIRSAFAAKGFDGASMQDLARAAGMSVGNFYRYFPSKFAIVEAMVLLDIGRMEQEFERILASTEPRTALREIFAQEVRQTGSAEDRLWAEIAVVGQRKSELAAICMRMEEIGVKRLAEIFAQISGLSAETCSDTFGAHARFLVLMIRANSLRPAGVTDPALDLLIMQGIDRILAEIPRPSPAGRV